MVAQGEHPAQRLNTQRSGAFEGFECLSHQASSASATSLREPQSPSLRHRAPINGHRGLGFYFWFLVISACIEVLMVGSLAMWLINWVGVN